MSASNNLLRVQVDRIEAIEEQHDGEPFFYYCYYMRMTLTRR